MVWFSNNGVGVITYSRVTETGDNGVLGRERVEAGGIARD